VAQLQFHGHRLALMVLIGCGTLSGLIGLAQVLGGPESWLYFYEYTNRGSPVGLFANRNHQAVFLVTLMPLVYALIAIQNVARSQVRTGYWFSSDVLIACAATGLLMVMVLATGSRSGALLSLIGAASMPFIIRARESARLSPSGPLASAVPLALVFFVVLGASIALTWWADRAVALDRLFGADPAEDMRVKILPVMFEMIKAYWPLGTGMGSFEIVYRLHEPAELLSPQYMNHAHNDWLELILTGGFPAAALMGFAIVAWGAKVVRNERAGDADLFAPLRRAGAAVLLILSLASISDYPLRTPFLLTLFAIAVVWMWAPASPSRADPALSSKD
jgi:O-antigen ligase